MAKLRTALAKPIYINAAFRSPIGKFGGSLKHLKAAQLAAQTLKSALQRTNYSNPELVLLGHARQAGAGPNTARQATVFSGLSETIPAITVNQACASGLTAIIYASEKIQLGRANNIWAGGVESMSNTPYLLPQARWGQRLGHGPLLDGMYQDGFHCPMADMVMGETVEIFIAKELGITRKLQDEFALTSQQKAAANITNHKREILNIEASGKNSGLDHDEHARADSTLDSLAKLSPVFSKEGTISAGNSSGITDGACWLHISNQKDSQTLAEILDYSVVALDPKKMGLGPIEAIEQLLKKHQLSIQDLHAIEINEAFAAQVIACKNALKIPEDKLNRWGGAIAIGHPIGATGARITTTLCHQIHGSKEGLGIASLCVSGGMGAAILIKSL